MTIVLCLRSSGGSAIVKERESVQSKHEKKTREKRRATLVIKDDLAALTPHQYLV
jgi:hypothetical protein